MQSRLLIEIKHLFVPVNLKSNFFLYIFYKKKEAWILSVNLEWQCWRHSIQTLANDIGESDSIVWKLEIREYLSMRLQFTLMIVTFVAEQRDSAVSYTTYILSGSTSSLVPICRNFPYFQAFQAVARLQSAKGSQTLHQWLEKEFIYRSFWISCVRKQTFFSSRYLSTRTYSIWNYDAVRLPANSPIWGFHQFH